MAGGSIREEPVAGRPAGAPRCGAGGAFRGSASFQSGRHTMGERRGLLHSDGRADHDQATLVRADGGWAVGPRRAQRRDFDREAHLERCVPEPRPGMGRVLSGRRPDDDGYRRAATDAAGTRSDRGPVPGESSAGHRASVLPRWGYEASGVFVAVDQRAGPRRRGYRHRFGHVPGYGRVGGDAHGGVLGGTVAAAVYSIAGARGFEHRCDVCAG